MSKTFVVHEVAWEQLKHCYIHNRTPKFAPNAIAGKILLHCKRQVDGFRERIGISVCVFKIGVTACIPQRFLDYLCKNFSEMWIIYSGSDLGLVHMLEAALISEFHQIRGCRNAANSGGEGGLNRRSHSGPPYFVYVTGGRADQFKRVG